MQIDRPLGRNRTWFDLKTRRVGGGRTETRDGTTSSSYPLSSSISNRSQDEYRIDAACTSSRRSGFTLEGVTGGEGERETKREREGRLYTRFPINLNACSSGDSARYRLVDSRSSRVYTVHEIIRGWTRAVARPLETTVTARSRLGSHDFLLTIAREMRSRTNRWIQMDRWPLNVTLEIEEGIEGIESRDLEDETLREE